MKPSSAPTARAWDTWSGSAGSFIPIWRRPVALSAMPQGPRGAVLRVAHRLQARRGAVAEEEESDEEAQDRSFIPHEFADRWQDLLEAEEWLEEPATSRAGGGTCGIGGGEGTEAEPVQPILARDTVPVPGSTWRTRPREVRRELASFDEADAEVKRELKPSEKATAGGLRAMPSTPTSGKR